MKLQFRLAIAALALSAIQCAYAAEPYKIGVSGPFTGGSAPMGISMRDGVRLAAAELNAIGGINGHKIILIEKDDQANAEVGVKVSTELVQEKVVATLGFINTGISLAAQKIYQQAKIPVINNVATGFKITKQFLPPEYAENYIFRNSAHDDIQCELIVRDAVDRSKFTKVAIFHDTTPYGTGGRDMLTANLVKRGIEPVAVESFALGTIDMSEQLARAKAAGAQVILTYGIGPELAAIANSAAKMRWKVPMVGSWTLSLENFISTAGHNAEGVRMPQTFIEEGTNTRKASFITSYYRETGVKRITSAVSAAQGYDSMLLLAAALYQANSTDGEKVREALENLKARVSGAVTTYVKPWSKEDHEAITLNMVVMGQVKKGRVDYAYSEDAKKSFTERRKK